MAFTFTLTADDLRTKYTKAQHLKGATDAEVAVWSAMAEPFVDEDAWGDLAQTGAELLVVHIAHELHKGTGDQGSRVGAQRSQTVGAGLTNAWSGPVGSGFSRRISATVWGEQFDVLRKSRASTAAFFA